MENMRPNELLFILRAVSYSKTWVMGRVHCRRLKASVTIFLHFTVFLPKWQTTWRKFQNFRADLVAITAATFLAFINSNPTKSTP